MLLEMERKRREKRREGADLAVVEAVGMWSGSDSVSCPHVHSQPGWRLAR